jgi:hypothetical protein
MSKHTYTLTFRGEHVQTFTTVNDVMAVRLGYRRSPAEGQHRFEAPQGRIARKPEVLRSMKTVAALKRTTDGPEWTTYADQTFTIVVRPGVTEITDVEVVE